MLHEFYLNKENWGEKKEREGDRRMSETVQAVKKMYAQHENSQVKEQAYFKNQTKNQFLDQML